MASLYICYTWCRALLEALWKGVAIVYISEFEKHIAEEVAASISSRRVPVVVGNIKSFNVGDIFRCFDAIVFVSPISIAVRVLCRNLVHKSVDPPVIVVDPGKRFAIPILGAHWGGNDIAIELSKDLQLEPVITTASDIKGITSIEQLARFMHCHIENMGDALKLDVALLRGEEVCVQGVNVLPPWVKGNYVINNKDCRYIFLVSTQEFESTKGFRDVKVVRCIPYKVSVGIGVHNDIDANEVADVVREVLSEIGIELPRVKLIASVKPIVGEVARILGIPFKLIPISELNSVDDPCLTPPSRNLAKYGVKGVAETCALSGCQNKSQLIFRKRIFRKSITIAIAACSE